MTTLTTLTKSLHVSHLIQCITGLPDTCVDLETSRWAGECTQVLITGSDLSSRLGIAYYALSALDLLGTLDDEVKVSGVNREAWRDWIWSLAVRMSILSSQGGNAQSTFF